MDQLAVVFAANVSNFSSVLASAAHTAQTVVAGTGSLQMYVLCLSRCGDRTSWIRPPCYANSAVATYDHVANKSAIFFPVFAQDCQRLAVDTVKQAARRASHQRGRSAPPRNYGPAFFVHDPEKLIDVATSCRKAGL